MTMSETTPEMWLYTCKYLGIYTCQVCLDMFFFNKVLNLGIPPNTCPFCSCDVKDVGNKNAQDHIEAQSLQDSDLHVPKEQESRLSLNNSVNLFSIVGLLNHSTVSSSLGTAAKQNSSLTEPSDDTGEEETKNSQPNLKSNKPYSALLSILQDDKEITRSKSNKIYVSRDSNKEDAKPTKNLGFETTPKICSIETSTHCEHCKTKFKNCKEFNKHLISCQSGQKFTCSICNRSFKHSDELEDHARGWQHDCACGACGAIFPSYCELESHLRKKDNCGSKHIEKGRKHLESVKESMANKEKKKKLAAIEDKKTVKINGKRSFETTSKTCSTKISTTCEHCKAEFINCREFNKHLILCKSGEVFSCSICNESFKYFNELEGHAVVMQHVLACGACLARFPSYCELEAHLRRKDECFSKHVETGRKQIESVKETMANQEKKRKLAAIADEKASNVNGKGREVSPEKCNLKPVQWVDNSSKKGKMMMEGDDNIVYFQCFCNTKAKRDACKKIREIKTCSKCNTKYKCNIWYKQHVQEGCSIYSCHSCEERFSSESALKHHIAAKHCGTQNYKENQKGPRKFVVEIVEPGDDPFFCCDCHQTFTSSASFNKHIFECKKSRGKMK